MFSIIYMWRGTFGALIFLNEFETQTQNLSSYMIKRTRSSSAPCVRDSNPAKMQFS